MTLLTLFCDVRNSSYYCRIKKTILEWIMMASLIFYSSSGFFLLLFSLHWQRVSCIYNME